MGVDVRSVKHTERGVLRDVLVHSKPTAVLDVGANRGQFYRLVRSAGFRGRVISFEPIAALHSELTEQAKNDPDWVIAPCMALGRASGTATINIARNLASSSILPVLPEAIAAAPEASYVSTQRVTVGRLDSVAIRLAPADGSLFLKIDTQGYEREVLLGSGDLLPRVSVMQLELSLSPLYEGAPLFEEMIGFIRALGYDLHNLIPGFRNPASGRLLQVDGFFMRTDRSRLDE
jgi:FkbM family methyltransferase